jgi:hypothetical protein
VTPPSQALSMAVPPNSLPSGSSVRFVAVAWDLKARDGEYEVGATGHGKHQTPGVGRLGCGPSMAGYARLKFVFGGS